MQRWQTALPHRQKLTHVLPAATAARPPRAVNCPLHEGTRGLFDAALIGRMKRGAFLVNTARGAICDRDAVVAALESSQLGGYAGDVWDVQPAPADHPWRTAPRNAMTPHYSGATLDAQARYAAGVKDILRRAFAGEELRPSDVIVQVRPSSCALRARACRRVHEPARPPARPQDGKLAPQYDKAAAAEHRSLSFQQGWEKAVEESGAK
jgi:hypothetical protein